MIDINKQGTKEQKILELVSEYGALDYKQIQTYFKLDEVTFNKILKSLQKKGRLYIDENSNTIKADKNLAYNISVKNSFYIVLDFINECNYHGISQFPVVLEMYMKGEIYSVFYCSEGNEVMICHSVLNMKENTNFKPIIILQEISQMEYINISNAFFCIVDKEGNVEYYTYE